MEVKSVENINSVDIVGKKIHSLLMQTSVRLGEAETLEGRWEPCVGSEATDFHRDMAGRARLAPLHFSSAGEFNRSGQPVLSDAFIFTVQHTLLLLLCYPSVMVKGWESSATHVSPSSCTKRHEVTARGWKQPSLITQQRQHPNAKKLCNSRSRRMIYTHRLPRVCQTSLLTATATTRNPTTA